uniref:Uncharacterized protein n=1 Tax=Anopheles culicifacies TaxID=139723 RepID=A0A182MB83_9DIPT
MNVEHGNPITYPDHLIGLQWCDLLFDGFVVIDLLPECFNRWGTGFGRFRIFVDDQFNLIRFQLTTVFKECFHAVFPILQPQIMTIIKGLTKNCSKLKVELQNTILELEEIFLKRGIIGIKNISLALSNGFVYSSGILADD